jgi:hypothetical protein
MRGGRDPHSLVARSLQPVGRVQGPGPGRPPVTEAGMGDDEMLRDQTHPRRHWSQLCFCHRRVPPNRHCDTGPTPGPVYQSGSILHPSDNAGLTRRAEREPARLEYVNMLDPSEKRRCASVLRPSWAAVGRGADITARHNRRPWRRETHRCGSEPSRADRNRCFGTLYQSTTLLLVQSRCRQGQPVDFCPSLLELSVMCPRTRPDLGDNDMWWQTDVQLIGTRIS